MTIFSSYARRAVLSAQSFNKIFSRLNELFSIGKRTISENEICRCIFNREGSNLSDEQTLIRAAQHGDSHALAKLMHTNYSFLLKYLLKIALHQQLAEDLAQETMLRAIERIKLYNGQSKFSSWLITIGTRLFYDEMRKRKRENNLLDAEQTMRKLRWQAVQQGVAWSEALEALGNLTEEARVPIVLKHYYGYAYEEIASMLDIPLGTVKSRIFNGIKQMRKELDDDGS